MLCWLSSMLTWNTTHITYLHYFLNRYLKETIFPEKYENSKKLFLETRSRDMLRSLFSILIWSTLYSTIFLNSWKKQFFKKSTRPVFKKLFLESQIILDARYFQFFSNIVHSYHFVKYLISKVLWFKSLFIIMQQEYLVTLVWMSFTMHACMGSKYFCSHIYVFNSIKQLSHLKNI